MVRKKDKTRFICTKCGREYWIRVSNPAIYTEEVIKNWTCILCPKQKKKK